ncbi:hypothetical protein ON010_g14534 [Phytophthora cinnamomi]|nr:hypothetical protein ON010_g14534 [Phytophthora cinnamomi]
MWMEHLGALNEVLRAKPCRDNSSSRANAVHRANIATGNGAASLTTVLCRATRSCGTPNTDQVKVRNDSSVHVLLRSVVLMFKENPPLLTRKAEFNNAPPAPLKGVADFVIDRGSTKLLVVSPEEDHPRSAAELHVMTNMATSQSKKEDKSCTTSTASSRTSIARSLSSTTGSRTRSAPSISRTPSTGTRGESSDWLSKLNETSLAKKQKYHRGRRHEEFWRFGGVERGTGHWFGRVVYNTRTKATLLPLIKKFIKPRTLILSDMFATYVCERGGKQHTLANKRSLAGMHYSHSWVNHTLNFVDPVTGTHTNTIEGLWETRIKRHIKHMRGMTKDRLDGYLDEYMWRSWCFPVRASTASYLAGLVTAIIRNE